MNEQNKHLEDAVKSIEQVGKLGKESNTETAVFMVGKVEGKDEQGTLAVAMVGTGGNLAEAIIRAMVDNPSVKATILTAAQGYQTFGRFFEDDGEPCDCPNCKEKQTN